MRSIYQEIQDILNSELGRRLEMDPAKITYESSDDPGNAEEGYIVAGRSETIFIPDEYMVRAGASSADSFLDWLRRQ